MTQSWSFKNQHGLVKFLKSKGLKESWFVWLLLSGTISYLVKKLLKFSTLKNIYPLDIPYTFTKRYACINANAVRALTVGVTIDATECNQIDPHHQVGESEIVHQQLVDCKFLTIVEQNHELERVSWLAKLCQLSVSLIISYNVYLENHVTSEICMLRW